MAQETVAEILEFLTNNFDRQARSDLPASEKIEALAGNLQLARETIEKNDVGGRKASAIYSVFSASLPRSQEFSGLKTQIVEAQARHALEL